MLSHARVFVAVLVASCAAFASAQAQAGEPWQISLNANESSPGWFRIQAWGTNVAGFRLEDCSCQLSVGGNAQIQPNGQGPIFLGDADNGQTLYYEFDVYSQPGGGDFTYTVLFSGYTYN